jgi:Family of unknown function (DUF5662)
VNKHLTYAKYILRHKYFVFVEGWRLHVHLHRLILHDWQKMTPAEWSAYVRTFYGTADEKQAAKMDFDKAWLHHQRSGSAHHWQSHILRLDDGGETPLPMPEQDKREMLADWRAMGRQFNEVPPAKGWYLKNRHKIELHPHTRMWIEQQLDVYDGEPG